MKQFEVTSKMRVRRFLGLLLLLIPQIYGALSPADCDSFIKIVPGKFYQLAVPFSWRFSRWVSYRWCATSETGVTFRCENTDNTEVFKNGRCDYAFYIFPSPKMLPYTYCGGNYNVESFGEDLFVTLDGPIVPSFKCYVEAVKKDTPCSCKSGKMVSAKALKLKKVVGGKETNVNEYPMVAAIVHSRIRQIFCGGTIISSRHVLTAAHCFNNPEKDRFEVLVGAHDIMKISDKNNSMLYRIEQRIVHPNFLNSSLSSYDIAIVTVAGIIEFTDEVRPACLPTNQYHDRFIDGSFLHVLGWGLTSFSGVIPNTLQVARVVGVNLMTCQKDVPQIEPHQICTYSDTQDACQFDSGGPVLWENPVTENLMVVGIISYGKGCASYEPSVNTRVSSFIGWIQEVTAGAKFCHAE